MLDWPVGVPDVTDSQPLAVLSSIPGNVLSPVDDSARLVRSGEGTPLPAEIARDTNLGCRVSVECCSGCGRSCDILLEKLADFGMASGCRCAWRAESCIFGVKSY